MIEIVETDHNHPDKWWRMLHFMLVRANNMQGDYHYYKFHNKRPESAAYFEGLRQAYSEAAKEVACRLDKYLQVFVDSTGTNGPEYKVRRITGEDIRRLR